MSEYSESTAIGLLIRGCPDPEGAALTAPVLWVNRDVGAISAPTGNLIGCALRPRIVRGELGVDGFVQKVSLQDLLGQGTQMTFRLSDQPKTATRRDLGQLFAPDPAQIATRSWMLKTNKAYLGKGVTTFDLVGPVVAVNDLIWIESEAIKILAVTEVVAGYSYAVTNCTRGVLGSRDREHVIRPSQYSSGPSSASVGLLATSRPEFDRYDFETEVYLFTLDGNSATVAEFWPRMTSGRPIPENGPSTRWAVKTLDVLGWAQSRKVKRSGLKLSNAVTVQSFGHGQLGGVSPSAPDGVSQGGPGNMGPQAVVFFMTVYEAERFLDRRFRLPFSDSVATADVIEFNQTLVSYPNSSTRRTIPEIVLKAGGYDWTFRITGIEFKTGPQWNSSLGRQYIAINGSLWWYTQESGAIGSVVDKPCPGYPEVLRTTPSAAAPGSTGNAQLLEPKRNPMLNPGWSTIPMDPIRFSQGEEAPEIKLRIWLDKMRPVEQIKTLLLSGQGRGQNDTDFDLLVAGLGPEVDPGFLNDGTASLTPITNDPRTKELKKLDQLLINVETVPLNVDGFDLGVELRRVCRAASLISSYVEGGLTFRQVSASNAASVTNLKQLTGEGRLVNTGARAVPMKALSIKGGHHPITLKPGWEQPIYLFDGGDPEEGETLNVYPPGGALTPDQWFAGPISTLVRVTFMMQRGSPPAYAVPTKRQRGGIYVGDAVSWTDLAIVGPLGRGVSSNRFGRWVCVGRDFNPFTGDQIATLQTDQLSEVVTTDGQLGAAFLVTRIGLNEAGNYCIQYQALTATSSGQYIDPLDVILACFENSGYVRLLCPELHNPQTANQTTRPGALECYGLVLAFTVYKDNGLDAYGVMELGIDPAWIGAGYDPGVMPERRTFLVMTDYRPKEGNVENAEIIPKDAADNGQVILAPGDGNLATSKPITGSLSVFDT